MTFDEYIPLALRTESRRPFGNTLEDELVSRICHALLGIISERTELVAAIKAKDRTNIMEELGDTMWYIAVLCDAVGLKPSKEAVYDSSAADNLSDLCKRIVFYRTPVDMHRWQKIIDALYYTALEWMEATKIDLSKTLERNIAKLQKRYPDKFTDWHAVNRDLKAELAALEG